MKKALIGCALLLAFLGTAIVAWIIYIGTVGPETFVVSGRQLEKRFHTRVQELGLLEEGEEIQYFYSDALTDITEGCYMVTDRHLILYSKRWPEPEIILAFDEIDSLEVEFDDSFFFDSYFTVGLEDGSDITFPISSEQEGDRRFYDYLEERRPKAEEPVLEAPEP